jgi:hypothetical protein
MILARSPRSSEAARNVGEQVTHPGRALCRGWLRPSWPRICGRCWLLRLLLLLLYWGWLHASLTIRHRRGLLLLLLSWDWLHATLSIRGQRGLVGLLLPTKLLLPRGHLSLSLRRCCRRGRSIKSSIWRDLVTLGCVRLLRVVSRGKRRPGRVHRAHDSGRIQLVVSRLRFVTVYIVVGLTQ